MEIIKQYIKKIKIKMKCDKGVHDWKYETAGNVPVDNLDDKTFNFWDIAVRNCKTCKRHEMNLKNGWEKSRRGLTINDLQ